MGNAKARGTYAERKATPRGPQDRVDPLSTHTATIYHPAHARAVTTREGRIYVGSRRGIRRVR